jgi:hypothetical protein
MTTANSLGTWAQFTARVRLDLAARRKLKQRVQMLRILHRAQNTTGTWLTPLPGRSDPWR